MDYKLLLQNQLVRYALAILLGVTIGAIFYPTKRIEEKITQKFEQEISVLKEQHMKELRKTNEQYLALMNEKHEIQISLERKITVLTTEVRDLKMKQKTAYYKIVRPDGTIEVKRFSESEVNESTKVVTQIQEEFKLKIKEVEEKWSKIHSERVTILQREFESKESEYKHTIAELQKTKTTTINEKRFSIGVGMLSNNNYYGHAGMDLWGPIFFDVHGQMAKDSNTGIFGAGIGLRF